MNKVAIESRTEKISATEASNDIAVSNTTKDANVQIIKQEEIAKEEALKEEAVDNTSVAISEGDIGEKETVTEGIGTENEVIMDEGYNDKVDYQGEIGVDPIYEEGTVKDPFMNEGMNGIKNPLLSSWGVIIGISLAVLIVSIGLGTLLAHFKIKKGIELYED